MSSYGGQKSSRTKVKPILRKLAHSNEKESLDLDRPAPEQDAIGSSYGMGAGRDGRYENGNPRGHFRSTSNTSQFSTNTTESHRTGSFVHPFQQTPYARPYTPPLPSSYQNSLRESAHSSNHQLEDEDLRHHPSSLSNRSTSLNSAASPTVNAQPLLRIQTKQSNLSSRLALATSNTSLNNYLTPLSPADITSPVDTITPVSTMRTSLDKTFRVRSHSHQDARTRTESIVEARRKFLEKEMAKDEKAAREEIRQLEKRNEREARKLERGHRRSSVSDRGMQAKRSKSDLTMQSEKGGETFLAHNYNSAQGQSPPVMTDRLEEGAGRDRSNTTNSAKKKANSTWAKFMMWIRTRFIRIGSKSAPRT